MERIRWLGLCSLLALLLFTPLGSGQAISRKMVDGGESKIHIFLCIRAHCHEKKYCYCCEGVSPCDATREQCEKHCIHSPPSSRIGAALTKKH